MRSVAKKKSGMGRASGMGSKQSRAMKEENRNAKCMKMKDDWKRGRAVDIFSALIERVGGCGCPKAATIAFEELLTLGQH